MTNINEVSLFDAGYEYLEENMTRLVIELKENGDVYIYSESDVDLTFIDWKEVREDADKSAYHHDDIIKAADKELLHKTTGLKQVYP